jgi:hypothetical protein
VAAEITLRPVATVTGGRTEAIDDHWVVLLMGDYWV